MLTVACTGTLVLRTRVSDTPYSTRYSNTEYEYQILVVVLRYCYLYSTRYQTNAHTIMQVELFLLGMRNAMSEKDTTAAVMRMKTMLADSHERTAHNAL